MGYTATATHRQGGGAWRAHRDPHTLWTREIAPYQHGHPRGRGRTNGEHVCCTCMMLQTAMVVSTSSPNEDRKKLGRLPPAPEQKEIPPDAAQSCDVQDEQLPTRLCCSWNDRRSRRLRPQVVCWHDPWNCCTAGDLLGDLRVRQSPSRPVRGVALCLAARVWAEEGYRPGTWGLLHTGHSDEPHEGGCTTTHKTWELGMRSIRILLDSVSARCRGGLSR